MSRLIDADALRETIEDHVTTVSVCATANEAKGMTEFKRICLADIDAAPTVDAVRVIRCAECAHWEPDRTDEGCDGGRCLNWRAPCEDQRTGMMWFCADGERKDDETS